MTNQPSNRSNDALIPAIILFGTLTLLLLAILPQPAAKSAEATTTSAPTLVAALPTEIPPTEVVAAHDPALINEGQGVYQSICTTCHGMDAQGIPGLGKNLVTSEFVASLTDEELVQFIIVGRDPSDPLNTTGIPMPARGGNPSLTDEQLMAVVAYLRTLAQPSIAQPATTSGSTEAVATLPPTAVPTSVPTNAPQVEAVLPTAIPVTAQPFSAASAYTFSCSGCHGVGGAGNEPFGPSLLDSPLLANEAELLAYITEGKPLADPRVEFPHPARGGYPALTDEELTQLVDYLHTLVTQ